MSTQHKYLHSELSPHLFGELLDILMGIFFGHSANKLDQSLLQNASWRLTFFATSEEVTFLSTPSPWLGIFPCLLLGVSWQTWPGQSDSVQGTLMNPEDIWRPLCIEPPLWLSSHDRPPEKHSRIGCRTPISFLSVVLKVCHDNLIWQSVLAILCMNWVIQSLVSASQGIPALEPCPVCFHLDIWETEPSRYFATPSSVPFWRHLGKILHRHPGSRSGLLWAWWQAFCRNDNLDGGFILSSPLGMSWDLFLPDRKRTSIFSQWPVNIQRICGISKFFYHLPIERPWLVEEVDGSSEKADHGQK